MIRVTVETEGDVSLADFDVPESEWDAPAERGFAVLNAAHGLAERTVRDLVMMVRAGFDQYWLGPSTEAVRLVGASRLVEAESGVQLPPRGPVLTIARPKVSIRSLTSDDLIEVLARLGEGEAPSLAEALLVDAEYHVMEQEVPSGDPSRAVLLAAIACEVKVKASLRERTPPGCEELLDFILDNPREITLTAVNSLFDKLMKAAQGRSLREDNRALFNKIARLFQLRNSLAHHGITPDMDEARGLVMAARRAFDWLDQE